MTRIRSVSGDSRTTGYSTGRRTPPEGAESSASTAGSRNSYLDIQGPATTGDDEGSGRGRDGRRRWLEFDHHAERLGLRVAFRYQKYRQEFTQGGTILAIDETPVGTYLEIEGDGDRISKIAEAMGRTQADYVVDSYWDIFLRDREARGLSTTDMVFESQ